MFCIIVPNRRKASPKFFSCVRTQRPLSRHSCPIRSPKSSWFSAPYWKTLGPQGPFLILQWIYYGGLAVNKNWLGKNGLGNSACHFSGVFTFSSYLLMRILIHFTTTRSERWNFVFVDIQYLVLDPDSMIISVPLVTLWMIIYGSLGLNLFCLWGRGTSWVVRRSRS